MHAIEVTETGGPEVLKYVDKPRPSPGPGEVLIKAEAIGLNFVDTYFRSGSYPHKLPFVLGAEIGGTVEALADGVTTLRVGDRVATADAAARTPNTALPQPMSSATDQNTATGQSATRMRAAITAPVAMKREIDARRGYRPRHKGGYIGHTQSPCNSRSLACGPMRSTNRH
jgi:NADPH2:quinone reductase